MWETNHDYRREMCVPYTLLLGFPEMYAAMHMQCTCAVYQSHCLACADHTYHHDYCVESYFVIIAMHALYYHSMDGDGIINHVCVYRSLAVCL